MESQGQMPGGSQKASRRTGWRARRWRIGIGVFLLLGTVLVVSVLWQGGWLPGGVSSRVASILREAKKEERSSSASVSRLRYSLPGPLADLFDRFFPRDWKGEYHFTEELVQLGTNAAPELIQAVQVEQSVMARRICAKALGDLQSLEAVPVLEHQLRADLDASVRTVLAEALGSLGDTNAAPALVESMQKDDTPSVRESCAKSLAELRARWTVPNVVASLSAETNRTAKVGMIEALGTFADARAVPVLVEHLNLDETVDETAPASDRNTSRTGRGYAFEMYSLAELRAHAAEALGAVGGDAALDALMERLEVETESDAGEAICKAMGQIRDRRAVPVLLARLDSGKQFKDAAIVGLGLIEDAQAVPKLLPFLDDRDEEMRVQATEALGRIGDASASRRLRQLLAEDPEESVRGAACTALALLGDVEAQGAIAEALPGLKDSQSEGIWALGHLGDSNSVVVLAQYLDPPADMESRFAAAYSLAEIGGPEAASLLSGKLADQDGFARHGKACALALLGRDKGLGTVRQGLREENEWQRFGAALAIVTLTNLNLAVELKPLANDRLESLRTFGDDLEKKGLTSALQSLLEGESSYFHHYAARAFAFVRDPAARPVLERACNHSDQQVREAARLSLMRLQRETAGQPVPPDHRATQ